MATPAQITANRANAQKSTGPRSVEGKSASRFNALKHGIDAASIVIPGEDPADYDSLAAAYHRDFRPETPSEAFHVETMLRAAWQKRRLQPVEADLCRTLLAESPAAKLLARVQRQIAAFERAWYRAEAALRRARQHSETDFGKYLDSLCAMPAPTELASFPQIAQTPQSNATEPPAPPTARPAPKDWPPMDEKTGRPLYFVG